MIHVLNTTCTKDTGQIIRLPTVIDMKCHLDIKNRCPYSGNMAIKL
jgi:hypothetical protein